VLGVVAIETTRTIHFTQSLASRFYQPVPLESPLRWRVWPAETAARRMTLRGELLAEHIGIGRHGRGAILCSFEGVFASASVPYAPEPFSQAVREGIAAESLRVFRPRPHGPWPAAAASIAARLVEAGFSDSPVEFHGAERAFEFSRSSAAKLRARLFYSAEAAAVAVVIHFAPSSAGPPGRANGGAVLAGFNMAFEAAAQHLSGPALSGADALRQRRPRLCELAVRFRSAVPLGCVALLRCTLEDGAPRQRTADRLPPTATPAPPTTAAATSIRLSGELHVPRCDGMALSADQLPVWADETAVLACTATALCTPHGAAVAVVPMPAMDPHADSDSGALLSGVSQPTRKVGSDTSTYFPTATVTSTSHSSRL
jgi:hypothetical protein